MPAQIIDGTAIAAVIREGLAQKVKELKESRGITPGLAVVIVGDNPASRVYVNMKKKACAELGIYSEEHALPGDTPEEELISLVKRLNDDPNIHGILVQLPLPDHIDEQKVIEAISPYKDVDGFHPVNVGRLMIGTPSLVSCTPAGIMELLDRTGIELQGKHAVVVGRSNIVGKPAAILLLRKNATVTVCHSRTANLKEICRQADVLVAAVGKPRLITGDMVKPGAVVIDVGVSRVDGKLVGDVDVDSVGEVASYMTLVKGGVGPMTITMLLANTVEAASATK